MLPSLTFSSKCHKSKARIFKFKFDLSHVLLSFANFWALGGGTVGMFLTYFILYLFKKENFGNFILCTLLFVSLFKWWKHE